jgi:hypothetical protein
MKSRLDLATRVARPALAALAASLIAFLPACQRDLPPDATYRALVRAAAERDETAAWNLLSSATQKRLEERARVAAAAAPGVVPASARSMLVGDASLGVRPPSSITGVEVGPDRAVLRVEAPDSPTRDVVLVREGGAWRVELPAQ